MAIRPIFKVKILMYSYNNVAQLRQFHGANKYLCTTIRMKAGRYHPLR